MKSLAICIVAVSAILLTSANSQAHIVALGTNAGAVPGTVTLWMGSYHTSAPFEGSIALIAGPIVSPPSPFTSSSATLPVGLVAGDNYFFIDPSAGVSDAFTQAVSHPSLPTVTHWQGATFTGLLPGIYTYQLSGMNSINFANWNTGAANWTGTLVIPESSTGVMPEPASMLAWGLIIGVGAIGSRMRKRKALVAA